MQVIGDTRLFVGNRGFNITFSVTIPDFVVKSYALAGSICPTERKIAFVSLKEVLFGGFGFNLFVGFFCSFLLAVAEKVHILFVFAREKAWAGEIALVSRSGELLLGQVSLNLFSTIRKKISSRQAPSYCKDLFNCFLLTAD